MPIPDRFWPPTVMAGFEDWIAAFWELSNDRQIGEVVGPIPSLSIAMYDVAEHERALFRRCIRAMDGVFLAHMSAVRKSGKAPGKALSQPLTKDVFDKLF